MVVTMKDVAELAGVSKSTVSQFLNKRYSFMSIETRKKIEESIESLDYRPNQLARSLKQKKSNLIAIVAANLSSRFTIHIISVIEKKMAEIGIDVIVASTEDNPSKEKKYVDSLLDRQVDGIIVFPTTDNEKLYKKLLEDHYPVVFMDRIIETLEANSVLLDNVKAVELGMEHLISKGHKNIGILTFPLGDKFLVTTRKERLNGYKKALNKYNIPVNSDYIKSVALERTVESLDEMMLLNAPPTAIVASNDMLLEKVLTWVKRNEVIIPDEISVIGIDDVSFANFYKPAITTVEQPIEEMGSKAAMLLIEQIENGSSNGRICSYRFDAKLNYRESVKQLN